MAWQRLNADLWGHIVAFDEEIAFALIGANRTICETLGHLRKPAIPIISCAVHYYLYKQLTPAHIISTILLGANGTAMGPELQLGSIDAHINSMIDGINHRQNRGLMDNYNAWMGGISSIRIAINAEGGMPFANDYAVIPVTFVTLARFSQTPGDFLRRFLALYELSTVPLPTTITATAAAAHAKESPEPLKLHKEEEKAVWQLSAEERKQREAHYASYLLGLDEEKDDSGPRPPCEPFHWMDSIPSWLPSSLDPDECLLLNLRAAPQVFLKEPPLYEGEQHANNSVSLYEAASDTVSLYGAASDSVSLYEAASDTPGQSVSVAMSDFPPNKSSALASLVVEGPFHSRVDHDLEKETHYPFGRCTNEWYDMVSRRLERDKAALALQRTGIISVENGGTISMQEYLKSLVLTRAGSDDSAELGDLASDDQRSRLRAENKAAFERGIGPGP